MALYVGNTKYKVMSGGSPASFVVEDAGTFSYSQYLTQYLTMEALETGTFSLYIGRTSSDRTVSYSLDDGATWTDTQYLKSSNSPMTITTPSLNVGDKVLWKCISSDGAFSVTYGTTSRFTSTGRCNIYGNILSLIYGDNFSDKNSVVDGFQTFRECFISGLKCISAEHLVIPIATLKNYVLLAMFQNNTYLVKGPIIVSSSIANSALYNMFNGCTSLMSMAIIADTVTNSQGDWARNVPSGGVLTKKKGTTWTLKPTGWSVKEVTVV